MQTVYCFRLLAGRKSGDALQSEGRTGPWRSGPTAYAGLIPNDKGKPIIEHASAFGIENLHTH